MLRRIAKTTLFATIVASVLCAGAASARQLQSQAQATCSGSCNTNADCAAGCVCTTNRPDAPKFCSTHYVGLK